MYTGAANSSTGEIDPAKSPTAVVEHRGFTKLVVSCCMLEVTADWAEKGSLLVVLDHWNWCCTGNSRCGRYDFDHWSKRCTTDSRCGLWHRNDDNLLHSALLKALLRNNLHHTVCCCRRSTLSSSAAICSRWTWLYTGASLSTEGKEPTTCEAEASTAGAENCETCGVNAESKKGSC